MTDPDFPAKQRNLAELEKHGCGRGGYPGVADRHKEDRIVTAA